jgi:hypothetical protein
LNHLNDIQQDQIDAIKDHIRQMPIVLELLNLVCDAMDVKRSLQLISNVRGANISIDPLSYDKGFAAAINFLKDAGKEGS